MAVDDKKNLSVENDLSLLQEKLTPAQFEVMCNEGTEPPFQNEYWDNKKEGIYVDQISGKPLFSSLDKYDSGTGWPSFTQAIDKNNIEFKVDRKFKVERIEVKSSSSKAHLGHVFDDGPKNRGGKRFCINSTSLRFIPKENIETALLAGGCFWGVEDLIRKLKGVLETDVGYAGGTLDNPTYQAVKEGTTGHAESVLIKFDPVQISYGEILDFYFKLHDPTTRNQQGNDKGTQYRSVIFTFNQKQKEEAANAIKRANDSKRWNNKVVTEISESSRFWKAEEYHQDYLVKTPQGYTCHWIRE